MLILKKQINCWIDFENLDGGRNKDEDDWTMKVRPILENPNCMGVVSYVSEEGFSSSGFIQECNWIKLHRPSFYCFLIGFPPDINAEQMLTIIQDYSIPGDSPRQKQIRDEALSYLTQATSDGNESYYLYEANHRHLQNTDFSNWVKTLQA